MDRSFWRQLFLLPRGGIVGDDNGVAIVAFFLIAAAFSIGLFLGLIFGSKQGMAYYQEKTESGYVRYYDKTNETYLWKEKDK